jgi:hypothetical protein
VRDAQQKLIPLLSSLVRQQKTGDGEGLERLLGLLSPDLGVSTMS